MLHRNDGWLQTHFTPTSNNLHLREWDTTEQTDTYAYKAYLETILNYGTEDEETILRPQGYYYAALSKERKKAVDGLAEMKEKTTGRKTIQLFGLPHVDLFNTGRMLIPGVDLKMRFTLNDPKFFMNGLAAVATNVRLQAGDLKMKFYACMVKVRSDVYNKIATARLQKNLDVYYSTVRSEIRIYTFKTITLTLKLQTCSMEESRTAWW